jgi:hypothetical protein
MPSTDKAKRGAHAPNRQMASFIAKFEPDMAKRIRACRAVMRRRLPTANEIVYDNYNFFVIGYGPNERPSHCIVSLVSDKHGVSLAFLYGRGLPDPEKRLLGNGAQVRSVRLPSPATLKEPAVDALLQAAIDRAKAPFAATGRGRTIIRSISSKQRPRR